MCASVNGGKLCTSAARTGCSLVLSGLSAKARGMDACALDGKPAGFAMPDVLIRLAAEADMVLT